MTLVKDELNKRLALQQFPRSAKYDGEWMVRHSGGPNVIWLTEALCEVVDLQPGMRVLDMGCGRAISSIFLAREFDVQVWATDLWVSASDNWERICDEGEQHRVFPIHAEAHTLPFADGFFDAAVSMDAYHYFGTEDLYIDRYSRLVKPGGQIGIVVPGLRAELVEGVPEELAPYWPWDFCSFHTPEWWRHHWEKTGKVEVDLADMIPNGAEFWLHWNETRQAHGGGDADEATLLKLDAGRRLGFTRMVARLSGPPVKTELQRAVERGDLETARKLLAGGADPDARNRADSTPIHHAIWACGEGQLRQEEARSIVELLLDHGADVNAVHRRAGTPLAYSKRVRADGISELLRGREGRMSADR
ncbi:MAG TPA: methyltransferase domain-containing protein [Candidatus Latescibacteria bacterium]|nr:methyltransferase domain-containing protein [Candidatus Latescibacterota bacterium]